MDELQQIFLEEAAEIVSSLEQAFLEWESDRENIAIADRIFRLAHNLKGSSKAVGLMSIGAFTHDLESLMLKVKSGEIPMSPDLFGLLLRCNDELAIMVGRQREGTSQEPGAELVQKMRAALLPPADPVEVIPDRNAIGFVDLVDTSTPAVIPDDGLSALLAATTEAASVLQAVSAPEPMASAPVPKPAPVSVQASTPTQTVTAPAKERKANVDEAIRVSLQRVDSLVTMIGELVILQTVLSQQRHLINSAMLQKTVVQLGKITKEIQDTSMGLRMVPLKQTFQKLQRIVRDTSLSLGKDIELELAGEDTELDKTVVDQLGDPLVHLIRNACDHGVEAPADRLAAGKPARGVIRLKAGHEGGKIVIEISDDGKGLDAAKLREKGIESGLVSRDRQMTDAECHALIFAPSFSTKSEVTDVSGRGVGMDVVRTNIEKVLKGEVALSTVKGQGTQFKISLPLTLAIIDAMVVRSNTERYVIPLGQVHESVRPTKMDLHVVAGLGDVLSLRGENLPIYRLSTLLGYKTKQTDDEVAIVVRTAKQPFALFVDEIIARQQVVIKRLGAEVRGVKGITGGAVLGDGGAALILELNDLAGGKDRVKGAAA